jgi:hypothetical protein
MDIEAAVLSKRAAGKTHPHETLTISAPEGGNSLHPGMRGFEWGQPKQQRAVQSF